MTHSAQAYLYFSVHSFMILLEVFHHVGLAFRHHLHATNLTGWSSVFYQDAVRIFQVSEIFP